MEPTRAPLDHAAVPQVVLAGKAVFTLLNSATGNRFTFKVVQCKDREDLFFVSVLTGTNNEGDYQYLGTIRAGHYAHGRKSRITEDAQSAKVFTWFWQRRAQLPAGIEVCHEGKCLRCARTLTVPASLATGIGPECIKHLAAA